MILFMDVGKDLDPTTENLDPMPLRTLTRNRQAEKHQAIVLGLIGLSEKTYPLLSDDELLKELTQLSIAWMEPMDHHKNPVPRRTLGNMLIGSYQDVEELNVENETVISYKDLLNANFKTESSSSASAIPQKRSSEPDPWKSRKTGKTIK